MLLFYFILFSAIVIKKDEPGNPSAIGYSGPTYIAIRSVKRSSSTALAHGFDFDTLLDLPEFQFVMKIGQDNAVKPVGIFTGIILLCIYFSAIKCDSK